MQADIFRGKYSFVTLIPAETPYMEGVSGSGDVKTRGKTLKLGSLDVKNCLVYTFFSFIILCMQGVRNQTFTDFINLIHTQKGHK